MLQNVLLNIASKTMLKNDRDNTAFNLIQFVTAFLIFGGICLAKMKISWVSVGLGAAFGILTLLVYILKIKVLAIGQLHITTLILTSSLIIPSLFGVVFGQTISVWKVLCILLLLVFIYFAIPKDEEKKEHTPRKLWLLLMAISFVLTGSLGVMQTVFQSTGYGDETTAFLAVSFLIASAGTLGMTLKKRGKTSCRFTKKHYLLAVLCGVTTFAMNFINLYLAGVLPTVLFFPMVNGASLIATSVFSVFLFRESLTRRQILGLIGGTVSLILIGII